MTKIRLIGDRAGWVRQVNAQFRTLQKLIDADAKGIATGLEREVPQIVRAGLNRRENPGRHATSLAEAIQASIAPVAGGRQGFGVGIRVTDPAILTRIAAYWHAIEVGSDHIIGIRVVGFGVRQGQLFSARLTRPSQHLTGEPDAIASRTSGAVVRKPIRPHLYLETVSNRAVARFNAKIGRRLRQVFE